MMSDSIDDVLDDDQAEEETEELANQVIQCLFSELLSEIFFFAKPYALLFITHFVSSFNEIIHPFYLLSMSFRFWMRLVWTSPHR